MRRILLAGLLLVSNGSGRAEDFSGFYAGINAGYASGQERTRGAAAPVSGVSRTSTDAGPDPSLPPSAVGAAASLRRPGSSLRGQGQR